ncbi:MAG TPA: ABC transporter ATP-binding protein [Planktothrix sp.]|jgi:ABC-type multidrug transport system fused ATPase/permease subunit
MKLPDLGKNPVVALILTGWKHAATKRKFFVIFLTMFAVAQAIALYEPILLGNLLNCFQTDAGDPAVLLHRVYVYLGLYFALKMGVWLFHGPARLMERYVAFHIKAAYKESMFKMLTEMPLSWHKDHHSGDSIDKINKAANSIGRFFDASFEVLNMVFRIVGALIMLFLFLPVAGWVASAASFIAVAIIFRFDRKLFGKYKEINAYENKTASALHDYVTNIVSVITLRLENRVVTEVRRRMMAGLDTFRRANMLNELKWFAVTALITVMIVFVLAYHAFSSLPLGQVILAGTFFTLLDYLRRIGESFYNFAGILGNTLQQTADVANADSLLQSYLQLPHEKPAEPLPAVWSTVSVEKLNFRYGAEGSRQHIDDIELDLTRGKAIALVGESGSGKSTLMTLLRGTHNAQAVRVECDGKLLPDGLRHLAGTTTLLPQDPEIFADTIRFNITFGLEATDEQIYKAIKLARFDAVLAKLPQGLDTDINQKGLNLSGGEKQRLALSRGIFFAKDSQILLLDEPTSSVDPLNERLIYAGLLQEFRPDKCIVSSIHKLHLLDMFDQIYVLSHGRIVEKGSLAELLASQGAFADLWKRYAAQPAQ